MTITRRTKTYYDWVVETVDEYEDIIDVNISENLDEAIHWAALDEANRIALRRDTYDEMIGDGYDEHDLVERGYAYLAEGDTTFDNGYDVPKRFLKQWKDKEPTK